MKKILRNIDKPLLIVSVILFLIGLVMVFSSSNVTAYMSHAVSPYNYFIKQTVFILAGVIMALVMIRFTTKAYGAFSWLLLLGVGTSLVALFAFGQAKNQAISWFDLGPFSFQPSEFMKIIIIVWMASYYETYEKKIKESYGISLFPIAIVIVIAGLILVQPDLGTAIIFSVIAGSIFMAVPIGKKIKSQTVIGIVGILVLLLFTLNTMGKEVILERQLKRLDYKNPCEKLLDAGSQVCNGYIAMNNGGLTGVGLGSSTQKYLYLPEPYTDFIYAIIVEELGLIFGIAILLMYMFILYRILAIGRKSHTNRGAVICYGVAVYIFCHIAVNLLGIFGVMPMTGVPLPFMSYGGSFAICLIAALTIVQRVCVENNLKK